MRILFVSACFPNKFDTHIHGAYKRMAMFIDGMKKIASLDMLFFVQDDIDVSPSSVAHYERLFSEHWHTNIRLFLCPLPEYEYINSKGKISKFWFYYGAGSFSFFKQSRFIAFSGPRQVQAFESCLLNNPDAIFVHKLHSMCPLMLTKEKLPPVYFDLDDIEHIAFKRSIRQLANWHERPLNYLQLPVFLRGQLRAIRIAHNTFVCSELDRRYLTQRWHLPGVVTIPNAVTIPEKQDLARDSTILFLGTYKYKPNVDAAEFLLNRVWPRIYKKMPEAKLIIAGANPERIRGYDSGIPNVTFTGFVDDLESLYRKTRIVCAPIFAGGGTRVKIIEAAAYGKAVIATRIGAEGLELHDGQEVILRDDPESFTEACLQLLRDHSLCERLGSGARAKAVQLYDRNNIVRLIQKHLMDAISEIPSMRQSVV